jgi:predicted ester cyclase
MLSRSDLGICNALQREIAMSTLEANKDLIRRAYETCVNQRQLDRASEFYAAEYMGHLGNPELPDVHGPDGYASAARVTLAAFPDIHETPEELVGEGDRVVVRHRLTGTHQAPFLGVQPTGKKVSFVIVDFYRVADGKIVEETSIADVFGLLKQLGAAPVPSGAA